MVMAINKTATGKAKRLEELFNQCITPTTSASGHRFMTGYWSFVNDTILACGLAKTMPQDGDERVAERKLALDDCAAKTQLSAAIISTVFTKIRTLFEALSSSVDGGDNDDDRLVAFMELLSDMLRTTKDQGFLDGIIETIVGAAADQRSSGGFLDLVAKFAVSNLEQVSDCFAMHQSFTFDPYLLRRSA